MRYLLKFSYDGSNFSGFQKQKGHRTVEEELETALTRINNDKKTKVVATGRTDKGVHALCQYGHADIDVEISCYKLKRAMNSYLPNDIHIISTVAVDKDFHARYNVKSKKYKYLINIGEYNPIERNYIYQHNRNLNIKAMKEGINYFLGEHDFRAFVKDNKEKDNCIRIITKVEIEKDNDMIIISFEGNGFLQYQVRNMVGTLIKVGEEKIEPINVKEILDSKKRPPSTKTAPAEGLYLVDVKY